MGCVCYVASVRGEGTIKDLLICYLVTPRTDTTPMTQNFQGERDYATYQHARREAILIFCAWAVALLWAVPYCYFTGFAASPDAIDPETMPLVLGIPSWVFWGIGMPWLAADVFTIWLCFFCMEDDDLGEAQEGADLAEEIAERKADH